MSVGRHGIFVKARLAALEIARKAKEQENSFFKKKIASAVREAAEKAADAFEEAELIVGEGGVTANLQRTFQRVAYALELVRSQASSTHCNVPILASSIKRIYYNDGFYLVQNYQHDGASYLYWARLNMDNNSWG